MLRRNTQPSLAQINLCWNALLYTAIKEPESSAPKTGAMNMSLMTVFVLIAAALAAMSLANGIVSMAHGGPEDQKVSHWLMLKRVGWQGLAFLLIVLALLANVR